MTRGGGLLAHGDQHEVAGLEVRGPDVGSVATVLRSLPRPKAARQGLALTYRAAILTGSSNLGDLGSAARNVSHGGPVGQVSNWGLLAVRVRSRWEAG
jgi:hypothetical protein